MFLHETTVFDGSDPVDMLRGASTLCPGFFATLIPIRESQVLVHLSEMLIQASKCPISAQTGVGLIGEAQKGRKKGFSL